MKNSTRIFQHGSVIMGSILGIWATAAIFSGLSQVNWQVSELLRQYLVAVGLMKEYHTFVDFYTHIKGVEYIIAVAFLVGFPVFYSSLNKVSEATETA
ncbi:MAG: hypothetical protein A2521_00260 [Deltaproteobacteria bacterium RIFOXYD12_FULL_57_12]|nr:MAG: hypothetical protein A2521_00260 [Deltaproteobacteria bacterium RIFOXYD12_FULL_57_12]